LTLTVLVSMFYAFNSIQTQPALNDFLALKNKAAQIFFAVLSVLCIVSSGRLIEHYGILPSRENAWFQIAAVLLAAGTVPFLKWVLELSPFPILTVHWRRRGNRL
jgi:hypothetical protein